VESAQRHELVLQTLRERDRVAVAELAELTMCSAMTIRRDLETLERDGLLRRVRGGAVSSLTGEGAPFFVRGRQQVLAKRRIGARVAQLLDDGESVVLDGGTTVLEVARALGDIRLTVLPLSLHAVQVLGAHDRIRLVLPGGEIRRGELAFVGALTEHAFEVMRFDTLVLGVCGLTTRDGVTAHDLAEAQVKRAAVRASVRVVAAADGSKLGRTTFGRVCPISDIDVLCTDATAPEEQVADLRAAGVEVHVA
jgi:DeoR/GlpR family transcriptional regulator of sugar metabolism